MSESSKQNIEGSWISLLIRIAISSLFVAAALGKFHKGLDGLTLHFQEVFKESWLPSQLVLAHAKVTPLIETIIPIWLMVGVKLRLGWILTALFTISLAFGMAVVGKYGIAVHNYFYVFLCCVGLHFSQYDKWSVDGWFFKK